MGVLFQSIVASADELAQQLLGVMCGRMAGVDEITATWWWFLLEEEDDEEEEEEEEARGEEVCV